MHTGRSSQQYYIHSRIVQEIAVLCLKNVRKIRIREKSLNERVLDWCKKIKKIWCLRFLDLINFRRNKILIIRNLFAHEMNVCS